MRIRLRETGACVCVLSLLAVVSLPCAAGADEIGVKGDTVSGTIKHISPEDIEIETDYGEGTVTILLEDVESVKSDTEFYFVHGDHGSTRGKLAGVRDGRFLVGDSEATAVEIDAASVHEIYDAAALDASMGWLRRATALWHGAFDLGWGITRSETDSQTFATGFVADRKKRPSRVTFSAGYRYGTQKEHGEETDQVENEAKALLRGEYDIIPRLFAFASQDAEYDEIEQLSYRLVPKAGLGYRFWDTKTFLFQLETGGAYVYENYFGDDDNGFWSIAFGKLLEWKLPIYDSEFHWRTDYLPAVDDFTGDYLVRSEAALLVPFISWLKLKFAVADTYDSTPATDPDDPTDEIEKNTLTSTIGLAAIY